VRILVTSFPALGHFHPVAPLALAARDSGHDVRVATGPDLADWVMRCGLEAHAVGLSQDDARRAAAERYTEASASEHLFTDVWVSAALPGLMSLAERWSPDLVVHEEEEYAALLLADLLGVPAVTHSWASPARPVELRERAAELLAPVWHATKPGARPRTTGSVYLDACPPPFQTGAISAVGDAVVPVKPVLFDGPRADPPDWLMSLPRPTAYVTLGTIPAFSTSGLLRTILDGLDSVVASVVVTSGPNPVEELGHLGASVHAVRYLPQSLVLPHADLMVSQAGAGGSVGALIHALPHLALPQSAQSQISVADRIDELGVGRRLSPPEQTQETIEGAARELLGNGGFARRAGELAAEFEQLPSPADALQIIATLASAS
jgi:UDP:flavonoid glycosyltransferase YjiC (YdhE family)